MNQTTLEKSEFLGKSSIVMKLFGWGLFPSLILGIIVFPEGFLWGIHHGTEWSPYAFMMLTLYLAWCILLIKGSNDPEKSVLLFDWAILANLLHAVLMLFQSFFLGNEMHHLIGDVPLLFVMTYILWRYSPRRILDL